MSYSLSSVGKAKMDPSSIIVGISNIFCGLLFIAISIPLLKKKIKRNHFYGMRFAKAFESEENWFKINAYGAKRLILWSVPLIISGIAGLCFLLRGRKGFILFLSLMPLIAVIPAIESYFYAKKL
jgi:hypothetical protein